MSYDNTILLGNITRDPELRYTASGMAVCNFTLAVSRGYGEKEKTAFIDITCWGKTAEAVQNYTKKGSKVLISGFHVQDKWTDKVTGQERTKLYISATEVKFLDSKPRSEFGGDDLPPAGEPTHPPITRLGGANPDNQPPQSEFTASGDFEVTKEDIPF